MAPEQATKVSGDGYLAGSLMHEIAHNLGPAYARQNGRQVEINEAIGPAYAGLEEAKADTVGMYGMKWLVDHDAMPKERLEEDYASYVGGLFRTLRFGTAEAHGRAEMMEFNYLVENGALSHAAGRYRIDYARMPGAIATLAKELLQMEATGDRARTEAWFQKYNAMSAEFEECARYSGRYPGGHPAEFFVSGEAPMKQLCSFFLAAIAAAQSPAHQAARHDRGGRLGVSTTRSPRATTSAAPAPIAPDGSSTTAS